MCRGRECRERQGELRDTLGMVRKVNAVETS